MRIKPIIIAAAAASLALALSACSLFKKDDSGEVSGFVMIPSAELEEDANAAVNKSYEQLKFRDGLTVSLPGEIEAVSFTQTEGFEKEPSQIMSSIFDEKTLKKAKPEFSDISFKDGDDKYAYPTYGFRNDELKKHCYIHSNGFFAFFVDEAFTDPENGECIDFCFLERETDRAKSFDLGGEQVTISQAAGFAQEWIDKNYAYLEPDFDIKAKYIAVYKNDSGVISFKIKAVKLYKGVELESDISLFDNEDELMKNVTSCIELVMRKKDSICFFTNGNGTLVPASEGKESELISLSSIMDYLSLQLADLYNDLEITEINLRRTVEPEPYDFKHGQQYFFPGNKYKSSLVWELLIDIPFDSFESRPVQYRSNERVLSYILVNAVTGEIIIDLEPWNEEKIVISTPEIMRGSGLAYTDDDKQDRNTVAEPIKEESEKNITIEVVAKSYKDDKLTFTYEGKSYTLPLFKENFAKCETGIGEFCPDIINNRHGIEVKAELVVDREITNIKSCDVYTPNGKIYVMPAEFKPDGSLDTEYDFTLVKGEGSKCSFINKKETVNADLNDLPMYLKLDHKDGTSPVQFDGFMFNDGYFMLFSLYTERDESGGYEWNEDRANYGTCFIGTVTKTEGQRGELALNDGVTAINIPLYFNDGEIKEGMTVMAMIYDDISLYGSADNKKYDYALIFTEPENYLPIGMKLEDAAYAEPLSLFRGNFKFYSKSEKAA